MAYLALALMAAGCSARNLDEYESGTGGSGGGAAGIGGGGTGNTGNSGGVGGASGGGGGGGATGGTGGSGGTTGGGGGTTGGSGGATGGSGGATGGSGGATGGSGGATGGSGGTGGTPVCGNNKLEAGEECDDGGKVNNDGCDSNCHVVCTDKNASAVPYTVNGRVHCYWRVGSSNSFNDSNIKCQNAGAHLATILTAGENALVLSLCPTTDPRYWIGGSDGQPKSSSTQAQYGWITGEPNPYVNWASLQPDWAACGTGCYQHRVAIRSVDGKWEDRSESDSEDAICEWEPKP